jgi:cell wall-associated NlpC family hydrolase
MNRSASLLVLLCLALLAGCSTTERESMVADLLDQAREKFAPDRRTVVFDVEGRLRGRFLTLTGEVHDAQLKEQLFWFIKQTGEFEIVDSVAVLPDSALGEKTFAVVSLSVANLRQKRSHAAEMGTQALLGTPLNVLKKRRGWYYVQTPDEYLCWTTDMIQLMNREEYRRWAARPKLIVTAPFGFTYESRNRSAQVVSDVVAGGMLVLVGEAGRFYQVEYPDGRTAYLAKEEGEPFSAWLARAEDTPESIVSTAKTFMGVPYLWGGTSTKGMDCSGYTKMVYFLNGVLLPRDASQQARVGKLVETDEQMSQVKPGDLVFFGSPATQERKERIWHVGISLGGTRFIHAAGDVRINSLAPADEDYSGPRARTFLRVKRIIGAGEESGVRRLAQVPYYRGNED